MTSPVSFLLSNKGTIRTIQVKYNVGKRSWKGTELVRLETFQIYIYITSESGHGKGRNGLRIVNFHVILSVEYFCNYKVYWCFQQVIKETKLSPS